MTIEAPAGPAGRGKVRAAVARQAVPRPGASMAGHAGFRPSGVSMARWALVALLAVATSPAIASAQDLFSGSATVEFRAYPRNGLYPEQHKFYPGLVLQPELFWSTEDGQHAFTFAPFFRGDWWDGERDHYDIREAYWRTYGDVWELEAGMLRTFWGVTESQHLVDIVNQTDQVENPDGEDKLGQPAVHLTWLPEWGTIDLYLMPLFRERTFPGHEGRFRFPLQIDPVADIDRELGLAARYFHFFGPLDLGVSYFHGTSREPRFYPRTALSGATTFVPLYEVVDQFGLDAQYAHEGWLWKLEAITRSGQGDRFYAFTGGFEYTIGNIAQSGIDLGLIAEYSHDTREADFANPPVAVSIFNSDLFMGSRLAFNDVQSTEILGGAVWDVDYGTISWLIESSRRLGDTFTVDFEVRAAARADPMDPVYFFRRDIYAQLGFSLYY